jgi:hypothetical protein
MSRVRFSCQFPYRVVAHFPRPHTEEKHILPLIFAGNKLDIAVSPHQRTRGSARLSCHNFSPSPPATLGSIL